MNRIHAKQINKQRRQNRVRARIVGTAERPRLSVHKSNRYLQAQIINDTKGTTLVSGSTREWEDKKIDSAKKLGEEIAKRAKTAGIRTVVFDRGGFRYTGRVATLAAAARLGGLKF